MDESDSHYYYVITKEFISNLILVNCYMYAFYIFLSYSNFFLYEFKQLDDNLLNNTIRFIIRTQNLDRKTIIEYSR